MVECYQGRCVVNVEMRRPNRGVTYVSRSLPPTVTAFVRILDELQYCASFVSFALLGTILPLVLYQVCFFCCLPVDWVV
jgi:hypothetical protein